MTKKDYDDVYDFNDKLKKGLPCHTQHSCIFFSCSEIYWLGSLYPPSSYPFFLLSFTLPHAGLGRNFSSFSIVIFPFIPHGLDKQKERVSKGYFSFSFPIFVLFFSSLFYEDHDVHVARASHHRLPSPRGLPSGQHDGGEEEGGFQK